MTMTGWCRALWLACLAVAGSEAVLEAQQLSIATGTRTLPSPDTTAYGSGLSATATLTITFPGNNACNDNQGCRLRVARSSTPTTGGIEVELMFTSGPTGDSNCGTAPAGWVSVVATPTPLVTTGKITGSNSCTMTVVLRARLLSYGVHQYPGTYFRNVVFSFVGL